MELIRFVLVEPTHPGNIGGVARAMKTMGLSSLYLVKPGRFPDDVATRRAVGAEDLLAQAYVCDSLDEALAGCSLVYGTSVRNRSIEWPVETPAVAAQKMSKSVESGNKVAVLFGRERSGLRNRELDRASCQIRIPANSEYDSLNLASAAQIIAYELRKHVVNDHSSGESPGEPRASAEDLERMYRHIEETLELIDFIKYRPPTKLMRKIIRMFNRAELTEDELQIIRGMMTAMQEHTTRHG
jgi:tRNA (cytidine32/uridine32-2'-O)-methyltransferase